MLMTGGAGLGLIGNVGRGGCVKWYCMGLGAGLPLSYFLTFCGGFVFLFSFFVSAWWGSGGPNKHSNSFSNLFFFFFLFNYDTAFA